MGHEPEELETRIARCERALFGDADSSEGLSSRMHMTETMLAKIDTALSRLNWIMISFLVMGLLNVLMPRAGTAPASHQSTSVITSDAADAIKAAQPASHRTYLTTAEVAAREAKSVREIQDMILNDEITPPPAKAGREYRIAADYRILPQTTADCGTEPQ